jgi:hypothetical protein
MASTFHGDAAQTIEPGSGFPCLICVATETVLKKQRCSLVTLIVNAKHHALAREGLH